jgi:hypothetical protein
MGRQPDTNLSAEAAESQGLLTPDQWARVVLERVLSGDTGTLRIRQDDNERTFRFLQGIPVSAVSTVDKEDFTETLVAAGVLEQARLDWIRKHTGAEESETEALIGAGTISREAVDSHHSTHIQHLIGAGLAWAEGSYEWQPEPQVIERFEGTLLPHIDVVEGLLGGVLGSFDLGALRTFIDASDAGDFLPDTRLTGEVAPGWFPADLQQIQSVLGQGHTREMMAEVIECDSDRLAAMLWMLEAAGWVSRSAPPAALIPLGTVATIQSGQPEPIVAPTTAAAAVQAKTPAAKTIKAKTQTKTTQKAAPKAAAAQTAPKKTLPKPARVPVDSRTALETALQAVDQNDFDTAYPLLIESRKQRPSCPDTLAAVGWTAWRTGNLGTNAYDGPEDFLLLALTFDAKHPKALEYYARIAIDKGEKETARNRLLQVLQVTPDASWAKEELDASGASRKGGMRLWPKSN